MVFQKRGSRVATYYLGSIVVAVGFAFSLKHFGSDLGPLAVAGAGTALCAAAHLAFLWYWRQLDETAREAHRYAVFWGSLLSMGPVLVAMMTLRLHPEIFPVTQAPPGVIFAFGLAAPMILWAAAILIGWSYWWLRRR
jgi:hypothetical protein